MAPEMAYFSSRSSPSPKGYGREIDLWAVGVIAYALLCGDLPFTADDASREDVVNAILWKSVVFSVDWDEKGECGTCLVLKLM